MKPRLVFAAIAAAFLASCNSNIPWTNLLFSNDIDTRAQSMNDFPFFDADSPPPLSLSADGIYSFIVVSDTHFGRTTQADIAGLAARLGDASFVVVNGDITNKGDPDELDCFLSFAAALLPVPCYPVIGNHDIFYDGWANWKNHIGSTIYRVDANGGAATLLFLDSANTFLGDRQLNWLAGELSASAGRVFVFSHVNLFAINLDNYAQLNERPRLLSILKDKAAAMFMGHSHQHNETHIAGTLYLTVASFVDYRAFYRVNVTPAAVTWTRETL
jgi:predicted phosphodiesterase